MKLLTNACLVTLLSTNFNVDAFVTPHNFVKNGMPQTRMSMINDDEALFQSILSEGKTTLAKVSQNQNNRVVLPESSMAPEVMLTSAVVAPPDVSSYVEDESLEQMESDSDFLSGASEDSMSSLQQQAPSSRSAKQPQLRSRKIFGIRFSDSGETLQSRLQNKDYNGIITSYIVPLTLLGTGAVWSTRQLITKYNVKMETVLTSYANEMIYHDGDFEEMQMCYNDYKKRLMTLGPQKKSKMLTNYLEIYAKKKPVSPQAISSLSHAFSMFKLSEENAAKALCSVAEECMKDKVASAGKLLFFGERILNSPGGQKALQPIREMLEGSYRAGGKQIVATSQKAMGEAAYRTAISAAGKEQTSLTPGWEILGLVKERAEEIYDEVAETGFKSRREQEYSGMRQKYDDKGRKVDDSGSLLDPTEATDDGDDDDNSGSGAGSVYECTNCGYTLFPAKGREFKFFPASFTCPECGAGKDKFEDRSKK